MTDFCAKTFYFLSNPFFQVISRTSSTCSPPLQRQAISNCHHNPHPHHFGGFKVEGLLVDHIYMHQAEPTGNGSCLLNVNKSTNKVWIQI